MRKRWPTCPGVSAESLMVPGAPRPSAWVEKIILVSCSRPSSVAQPLLTCCSAWQLCHTALLSQSLWFGAVHYVQAITRPQCQASWKGCTSAHPLIGRTCAFDAERIHDQRSQAPRSD